jgi:hypothetical protein
MNGFVNPQYFLQMIRSGKNPEQLMMDFFTATTVRYPYGK